MLLVPSCAAALACTVHLFNATAASREGGGHAPCARPFFPFPLVTIIVSAPGFVNSSLGDRVTKYTISAPRRRRANQKQEARKPPQRVAKAPRFRGNPFLPAYAGQKFLPPNIPLGTKLSAEPRTRRKAARTLSALNFPVCVPSIRTCRLDGTFLSYFWAVSPGRTWPAAPRWGRRCGRNGGPGARRGRYGRSSRRSAPAPPAPPRRTDSPARRCWRHRRAGPGR